VSQAVARGDVAALNYFVAQQYLKALGQLAEAPNQKILMLPIEATGVLASLGGIAEIARETLARRDHVPVRELSRTRLPGRGGEVTTGWPEARPE